MSAEIIRIVGPSYCGSTALGCAMNTGDGFFFGSEMRRLLKSFRDRNRGRFGLCDFCGRSCEYWSADLYDALRRAEVDSLPALYQEFTARHPEIKYLVDGSKTLPGGEEAPDYIILPMKHPLKLIASHIYNKREDFGIHSEKFELFAFEFERSVDNRLQPIRVLLRTLLKHYRTSLASCPDAFTFKSDEAHREGFRLFRALEHHVGVPQGTFDPGHFSNKPAHTIAGNRAPIWIIKHAHGQATPQNPRRDYYASSVGIGDWKLDNKYLLLIRPAVLHAVRSIPAYVKLCDLLAYELRPRES